MRRMMTLGLQPVIHRVRQRRRSGSCAGDDKQVSLRSNCD